jgi:hypothetical protein
MRIKELNTFEDLCDMSEQSYINPIIKATDQRTVSENRKMEIKAFFQAGNERLCRPYTIGEILRKYRVLSKPKSRKGATQHFG